VRVGAQSLCNSKDEHDKGSSSVCDSARGDDLTRELMYLGLPAQEIACLRNQLMSGYTSEYTDS
jgi:hypothetical protein